MAHAGLALALSASLTAGCAALAPGSMTDESARAPATEADLRIAEELVDVLARVPPVAPAVAGDVRVEIEPTEPRFGSALVSALRELGYAVAVADGDADAEAADAVSGPRGRALPVGYTVVRRVVVGTGPTAVYTVALGDVQARRSWSLREGAAAPDGPLYVRGADVASLASAAPDVPAPDEAAAPLPVGAGPIDPPDPIATADADADAGDATKIAVDAVTGRPVYGGLTRQALGEGPGGNAPSALPTERNVMDLGDSNFADLFVGYEDVTERILVFGDDSVRLGEDNKAILAEVVDGFDPARDVFALVGCSLGPTALPNGNERLALGRANRVEEELVLLGVPSERIVDEGCWAGDASARFPSRGVVLTLRRSRA